MIRLSVAASAGRLANSIEGKRNMANVKVEYSRALQDYLGVRGSMQFTGSVVDTSTAATLATSLQTLETTVDAVTGAAIIGGSVRIVPPLVGGLKAAIAGADLEQTM